jgi:hypothetical protein
MIFSLINLRECSDLGAGAPVKLTYLLLCEKALGLCTLTDILVGTVSWINFFPTI